ncbi:MAG: hypothetical protein HS128_21420 [Ideonella sp.]|nr:hypothetical protein [Ideonella sp.]MCC7457384.1 hypothetical protein [Nitrospira sp.]
MTRAGWVVALVGVAGSAAGQAGPDGVATASAVHDGTARLVHPLDQRAALAPFGWLAKLAGHCWRAESPHGTGAATVCYQVDARHGVLLVRSRNATGGSVDSAIRPSRGALLWQTTPAGPAPTQHCWLLPDSWSGSATPAITCRIADPSSRAEPPASWSYRFEAVADDRYRVVETFSYGGAMQAMPRHAAWLFVRSGVAPAVDALAQGRADPATGDTASGRDGDCAKVD